MPQATKEPCNQCPFRRKSMPGWLGDSTPEQFMDATMKDYPMPCHQTVEYDRNPRWKEKWEALVADDEINKRIIDSKEKHCAGAAIFFANITKRSRDPQRPRLPADDKSVFTRPQEFIDHHRSSGIGSWEKETKK